MKIGLMIPTAEEAVGLPEGIPCATGFGPGKTAACAAAAKLLFHDGCDAILVWGTAGALKRNLPLGQLMLVTHAAYSDYDVAPLYGSDGVGFVPGVAEECWMECDAVLGEAVRRALASNLPGKAITTGRVAAGDVFDNAKYYRADNRIENSADIVEMESPAVIHFCRLLERKLGHPHIPVAVMRLVSNYVGGAAAEEFQECLTSINELNLRMGDIMRTVAMSETPS